MDAVQLVFYFVLLLWLIQAAASQEEGNKCGETCGNITIPFPFGIQPGCYTNSWFRVTCNKTVNGPKPFISRINLELITTFSFRAAVVKNPVNYLKSGDKGSTGGSSVNLSGSPFFFSGRFNLFGSVGCGNLATIFGKQTDHIGGCLQPRCGDLTSKLSGCFSLIPENLTSYTVTMKEIINPGKQEYNNIRTCAFMFSGRLDPDLAFPREITIDTTHVPAALEWNPVKCDLEATLCQEPGALAHKSTCTERCGSVDIPFPFGIEAECYMTDWFRVTCNETDDGPKPFISSINLQLLNVSFSEGKFLVNHPVTYSNCRNQDNNGISVDLIGSPFFFSDIDNAFWFSGCGSLGTVFRNQTDIYHIGSCLQPGCRNIDQISNAGCLMMIPRGLNSFFANMTKIDSSNGSNRSCGYAFVIDSNYFDTYNRIIIPDRQEISKWTHAPTTLQWGKPTAGMCELKSDSKIFCSSDGEYCWTKMSSQHLCVCSVNGQFDSTLSIDVCRDAGGKCANRQYKYCHILCLNTPGNYCSSPCPDKYKYMSSEDFCESIKFSEPKTQYFAIIIGCTSIGTIFVLLGTWQMYKVLKRRKNIKLKQKYFKRNGGLLLQQQLSSNDGNVEKIRLFPSEELETATDCYNENRILGQGGQGTVYKGMLTDGSIVAIKKSKMRKEKKFDEKKLEQFINEVVILSQINHRNVVKLLGCCLETEVPSLVYEFIPNGTLCQFINDRNEEFPLTWEIRLRIAIEIANALCYLHSAASVPIYHRDIKSSNILLTDKYTAKVSDFGISRSVSPEQTHLTTRVHGTFGYLDPEYFRSSQFTEKSDVYSFGVVLVELLTGQKPISTEESEEVRSLVSYFLISMKASSLFDILDPMITNDSAREEIIAVAKLAKRCLNLNGKRRPAMKQVAMELESIRASEEANAIQESDDEDSDIDDIIEPRAFASCSTSRSIVNNGLTL